MQEEGPKIWLISGSSFCDVIGAGRKATEELKLDGSSCRESQAGRQEDSETATERFLKRRALQPGGNGGLAEVEIQRLFP